MRHLTNKILLIFIGLTLFCFTSNAESNDSYFEVKLITGEVYVGEIILKTEEIVILKTDKGERFQFPISSVKSITPISDKKEIKIPENNSGQEVPDEYYNQNFCGMIELSGGFANGKNAFTTAPWGDFSLSLGTKSIAGKSLFIGLGAGYSVFSISGNSESQSFIPVFIRLQSNNLSLKRTSPFLSLDAGYTFNVSSIYSSGAFGKLSGGIVHRINYKTSFSVGLFTRVQHITGTLTENIDNFIYSYNGNSTIMSYGVTLGLMF